jgi:hypothetical protein
MRSFTTADPEEPEISSKPEKLRGIPDVFIG